jgi:phosphoribosylamine--glycine ligase
MGAYAPVDRIDEPLLEQIEERILVPVVDGLRDEGVVYKGCIYAGLMLTGDGPKVLEFNCRFGDPETQSVLPLLKSDLGTLVLATLKGELSQMETEWERRYGVCVVVSSGGYPMGYEKGKRIYGLADLEAMEDVQVFHAGTKQTEGEFITSGGRVLGVTGLGTTLDEAIQKSYQAVARLDFEKMYYRKDIGSKGISSSGAREHTPS